MKLKLFSAACSIFFLIFSCSGDDDNQTNSTPDETIQAEWELHYLVNNGRAYYPSEICNYNNLPMNLLIDTENTTNDIVGNTPCNTFLMDFESLDNDSFKVEFSYGITEVDCSSNNADCIIDGADFEEYLLANLASINDDTTEYQEVNYRIGTYENVDSLVIEKDGSNRSYYWRNN